MTILDEQQITEKVKMVISKIINLCDRWQMVKLKGWVFIY